MRYTIDSSTILTDRQTDRQTDRLEQKRKVPESM